MGRQVCGWVDGGADGLQRGLMEVCMVVDRCVHGYTNAWVGAGQKKPESAHQCTTEGK